MDVRMERELHAFLISEVDGGEWSDSSPGGFSRKGKGPSSGYSLNSKLGGLEVRSRLFGEE